MTQGRLKRYLKITYDIDICRNPDEAYIIHYKTGKIIVKACKVPKMDPGPDISGMRHNSRAPGELDLSVEMLMG